MWNLKYDTNEHIYETNRLTENRLVVAKGERLVKIIGKSSIKKVKMNKDLQM